VRLLTAHRILIGSFVAFLLFFAFTQVRAGHVVVASISLLGAAGFAVYLLSLRGKTL